ncbi:hypothetical protein GTA08_BOTSDO10091 [Botryosphaeria dothidea]|uniref:Uncharacterized protein n=1 Tax=Botryosphaeria dothidea TaxID=55169 RepID=A0A8H4MYW2_9PEZI|nr:hypothetical protein GTA08_BOTSDO10091 [Botryosphaeria dothidea]
MSKSGSTASTSDSASVMSTSSTKSTTSLLKKVFHKDHPTKTLTDAQIAAANREREEKANYLTAAATYMSLR